MPDRWFQIKGDPSIREFLFQQTWPRVSLMMTLNAFIVLCISYWSIKGGVCKAPLFFQSMTCWFSDDSFRYRVFVMEEVLEPGFIDQFRDSKIEHLQSLISAEDVIDILVEFNRLRTMDDNIYIRNGSINRVNGLIGMTFFCDGAHYIDHNTFFEKLENFGI